MARSGTRDSGPLAYPELGLVPVFREGVHRQRAACRRVGLRLILEPLKLLLVCVPLGVEFGQRRQGMGREHPADSVSPSYPRQKLLKSE